MVLSILDTDLYKITMQAVVHKHYPDADVEYLVHNRSINKELTEEAVAWIRSEVASWSDLKLSEEELGFLRKELYFLPEDFFTFLASFRLNPAEEVDIQFSGGKDLRIAARGKWETAIWYEVPILATVSEAYFRFVDTDWDLEGQEALAAEKTRQLIDAGATFSEFGTRRRRAASVHRIVLKGIIEGANKSPLFLGTSNVHFARELGLKPIGTVAHELIMGIAAYTQDYPGANKRTLQTWLDTIGPDHAGVVLTDTFGTSSFLKDFVPPFSDIFAGVRQDSGDPAEFTKIIASHYQKLGIPPNTKRIVYSDSLNVERSKYLKRVAEENGLIPSFGIGTFFTNDFNLKSDPRRKSEPMNIVMKINTVNGHLAVKISDNSGKNTGDEAEVKRVKEIMGYRESDNCIDESHRW